MAPARAPRAGMAARRGDRSRSGSSLVRLRAGAVVPAGTRARQGSVAGGRGVPRRRGGMRLAVASEPSSLKAMVRVCSVYGVSSLLSRSIAFLLLPLYTRVLTPEEYGIRAMVGLGLELTMLLAACGLKEAINRFYAGGDGGRAVRPEAASTGILTHM